MTRLLGVVVVVTAGLCVCFLDGCQAFLTPHQHRQLRETSLGPMFMSTNNKQSIVVISPPGGIGEVAAVESAKLGSSVRWFVVNNDDSEQSDSITLTPYSLQQIQDASGSLDLAGSSMKDLQTGGDALLAVSKWCSTADGIIACYDGCEDSAEHQAAIRLATQQAASAIDGPRVAIVGATEELDGDGGDLTTAKADSAGIFDVVGSLFKNSPDIPPTLIQALGPASNLCVLRHGQLFGIPESSPNFSPLVGGPKRDPLVCEEYTMRTVRLDPFILSTTRSAAMARSCRHAVGQAAALVASRAMNIPTVPIVVSSQVGTDVWELEDWKSEMDRLQARLASGKATELFSQAMIVDNVERLAEWLATKWAPAVLRTYEMAAIRVGARPVYCLQPSPTDVEIVWQQLQNMETVVVGKLFLQVTKDGITATRQAGDASKGYGIVSRKPLAGEDIWLRRLAEAASQAIDKGLAKKVRMIGFLFFYFLLGWLLSRLCRSYQSQLMVTQKLLFVVSHDQRFRRSKKRRLQRLLWQRHQHR